MATVIMMSSKLNGYVIDIENNSTTEGAGLDAFPPKSGTVPVLIPGGKPPEFAANQSWEVLPDPAGSKHVIIKNPATGHCIDIKDNSVARGAGLDVHKVKSSDNQNQLWDLLPDEFGSGGFYIQNPQTGYVIEIKDGSTKSGAPLVVNPRRMFDSNRQLWSGIVPGGGTATGLPLLQLFESTVELGNAYQYALLPPDQTKNLTGVTVTLEIIEDLVADSFSVQINGNPPYPAPGYHPKPGQSPYKWDTRWMQFGLVMTNNNLVLFNQIWGPNKGTPLPPGETLPSEDEWSSTLLALKNNTVPAGTKIVLKLATDPKNDDYVTGVSGQAYDGSAAPIGNAVNWPVIGQPTFGHPNVTESDLAPLGAFQVVVVGAPGGHAHFTAGLGTITVTSTPDISAQLSWPDPESNATGETSNIYYGLVQNGYHHQIAQPFGVPGPRITSELGNYTFSGTGLYPNSKLTARSDFNIPPNPPVAGEIGILTSPSAPDGSFSVQVLPKDPKLEYEPGTVTVTVTDADGNWAAGSCGTPGSTRVTSWSGLRN
jgi:hypothetical protein